MKKNIAIIGGGIAGITAAYYLNKKHHITLFEKQDRMGGNAYTIPTPEGDDVDIAVAAFGKEGYQNFYSLLDELGIKTQLCANTFMSFHNMDTDEGLYLTPTLKAGLRQGFSVLNPKNVKSLYDLFLGIRDANKLLEKGKLKGMTLREAIKGIPRLKDNSQLIFLCTLCLLSSMSYKEVLDTPAEFFINKLKIHNDVISPKFLYSVRAVDGGTNAYITALTDTFKDDIVLNANIKSVVRKKSHVEIHMKKGKLKKFDAVIFACNADQALTLLDKPTKDEARLLGVWKYKEGRVIVHKDHSHFPSKELIQAYTFLYQDKKGMRDTSVNGALWFEPDVSDKCDYICAQHPNYKIRKDLTLFQTTLRTPKFDFDSIPTISELPKLNGNMSTYYCGSHFGFGLHDDAITSAVEVVKHFGIKGPKKQKKSSISSLIDVAKMFRS